jgi:hypothetical protein
VKKTVLLILLVLISALTFASGSFALQEWFEGYKLEPYYYKSYNPLIKQYKNGLILDLIKNRVVARGEKPITGLITYNNRVWIEKKATENSINALMDAVGQLRLSTNERVYNLTKNDPDFAEVIRQRVKKTVEILHYRIFTMRRVLRVTSSVKYKGPNSLLNVIFPYIIEREKAAATLEATVALATEEAVPDFSNVKISGSYTGLIIDARGLKVEPAIDPRIVGENGADVYGTITKFDLDQLYKRGKAGYTRTMDAAYSNYRAGQKPLVVKASSAKRNCDPIVSAEDAHRIIKEDERSRFLDKLFVTIVI